MIVHLGCSHVGNGKHEPAFTKIYCTKNNNRDTKNLWVCHSAVAYDKSWDKLQYLNIFFLSFM